MKKLNKDDFPETVHGLLDTTKTELLKIIARKDEVEKKLGVQLNQQKSNFERLVSDYNQLEKTYNEFSANITTKYNEIQDKLNKAIAECEEKSKIITELDGIISSNNILMWKKAFLFVSIIVVIMFIMMIVF